jgi:hypothetical protein
MLPTVKGYGQTQNDPGAYTPVIYYTATERAALINSGKYVPQNFTEVPFNLNVFPIPNEYRKKSKKS